MSDVAKIIAPTNNVNDISVVVYEFLTEDGAEVEEGQEVIAVETSKATTNILSTANGFIRFVVSIGDEIPNGGLLAVVGESREQIEAFGVNKYKESDAKAPTLITSLESSAFHNDDSAETVSFGIFDEAATLGEIGYRNGEWVEKGSELCKVRIGRKTETVKAPCEGFVHWNFSIYETLIQNDVLGTISKSPIFSTDKGDVQIGYKSLRVSKEAQRILDDRNIFAEQIGLSGLVTATMVKHRLNPKNSEIGSNLGACDSKNIYVRENILTYHSTDGSVEKLSKAKRTEATYLSDANRETIVSQVSVLVPTKGIFDACAVNQELAGKFSAIIIFETARILRNYRHMTSVYDNDQLFVYDHINIGYALSINDGLKVPVFRDADRMELEAIIVQKEKYIEKYVSGELAPDDISGGTFTITDLSSTGCYMFNPVLNIGQSVILGIGGENPEGTNYPLILAFDHRVIDGVTATEFLVDLKERLVAHENVLIGEPEKECGANEDNSYDIHKDIEVPGEIVCDSCFRSVNEVDEMGHYMVKSIDGAGREKHICSICMRGW